MMITNTKNTMPVHIVKRDTTFSGPLSLALANKPKSPEPVKALKPSDFPPCNNDNIINTTATINKIVSNIFFTSRRMLILLVLIN